jgi:multidrug efflux pump
MLVKWLVDHATTVLLAATVLIAFGSLSYFSLPRESSPDISIPVVLVNTGYQGVAPEDIESLITIPIERELAGLKDVKVMNSTSAEGFSMVSIEFEPNVVIEEALQKVRDRVNRAKVDLPADATEPSIREINFSDIPILLVTIAGDADEQALKRIGEDLKDAVSRIPGVLDTKVSGGLEKEIKVQVDPTRLSHYQIALNDLVGAIANENSNTPGGEVRVGQGTVLLRTPAEFTSVTQIEQVSVKRVGDRSVFVRDIASVVEGYEDRKTYARMNGRTAVSLSVTKRPGMNLIHIADEVKVEVERQSSSWPSGVEYRVLADESIQIRNMVSELQNNIVTALLLVLSVILLFMGARPSFFVAMAVPLSMLLAFAVLDVVGFTLNMIVLFSLILALGMLVDNAIVIVENIYRHMEEGSTPYQAAIEGTNEVAVAVATSTTTTVCAFLPLVFWTGMMGEFMGFLPKTTIIVLVSSLVVAIGFLPAFTSRMLKGGGLNGNPSTEPTYGALMRTYRSVLKLSIRFRYVSAAAGFSTLLVTFVAYSFLNHGTEFFAETEPDKATIGVRLADGTDIETTDALVREIESVLAVEENVDVFVAETGVSGSGNPLAGAAAATNSARITIDFLKNRNSAGPGDKVRIENTAVTIDRLREVFATYPGAEVTVNKQEMGPPVGKPISVEISGDDYNQVGQAAQVLRRQLATIEGVAELKDNYRVGRPELRLKIDRGAAARVGLSSAKIGSTVRTAVAGAKASALRVRNEEYDIIVELAPEHRHTLQQVLNLRLPGSEATSPKTYPVPLSSVARYELAGGTGAIQHKNQDLVITIEGDVLDGHNANAVQAEIEQFIANDWDRPEGVFPELKGANQEQDEAAAFLLRAFAIACALIMLVLVTQFDSVAMPAIIMATVSLSLVGVLWGLILTGTPFGIIMTGIGVISLAGIVVNNAIVLLDYVMQLEARGMSVEDALVKAGTTRFRPVMLTAITTVLGLVPMALGMSVDFTHGKILLGGQSASWWGPMAWAVIFGLSFATVLTLVMVPTLFSIYDDWRRLWARVRKRPPQPIVAGAAVLLLVLAPQPAKAVTLQEAYSAAEEHNLDLLILREQAIQAKATTGEAVGTMFPQIDLASGYHFNQYEVAFNPADMIPEQFASLMGDLDGDPIIIQPKRYLDARATVTQELLSGTAYPILIGAFEAAAAARWDEKATRAQIHAGVARTYYGLLQARRGVELADQALKTRQGQLQLATRQRDAEMTDERAHLQARLAVSRAMRDVDNAKDALQTSQMTFRRVTGLSSDTALETPTPMEIPKSLDAALVIAKRERNDLLAARARVDVARAQRLYTQLSWIPRVDGSFSYLYSENTGFNPDQNFQWVAGINATWPLWDGGSKIAKMRKLGSQVKMSRLILEKQERNAVDEVTTLWDRSKRATEALDTVKLEVELSRQNLELTSRAFEGGSATWLEVEQAELALRSAEQSESTEQMNRDLAVVDLLLATGHPVH